MYRYLVLLVILLVVGPVFSQNIFLPHVPLAAFGDVQGIPMRLSFIQDSTTNKKAVNPRPYEVSGSDGLPGMPLPAAYDRSDTRFLIPGMYRIGTGSVPSSTFDAIQALISQQLFSSDSLQAVQKPKGTRDRTRPYEQVGPDGRPGMPLPAIHDQPDPGQIIWSDSLTKKR